MPSLHELGKTIGQEPVAGIASYEEAPAQWGGLVTPPQPGRYIFEMPEITPNTDIWIMAEDVEVPWDPGIKKTFVSLRFTAEAPLVIKEGGDDAKQIGEPFMPLISGIPRNRARKGQPEVYFSDLDYFLRDAFKLPTPKTMGDYLRAVLQCSKRRFAARVTWRWTQREGTNIWMLVGSEEELANGGGRMEEQDGIVMPDRVRYYQGDVPRGKDGKYPLNIAVPVAQPDGSTINAMVRAQASLEQFGVVAVPEG